MNYQLLNLFDCSNSLPDFDFNCKFILIENLTEVWLVIGPLETYRYHAQLVHKFCAINDVTCEWLKVPDLAEIHDTDYEISGGGIFTYKMEDGMVELKGNSTAYGKFDSELVGGLFNSLEIFDGLQLNLGT